MSTLMDKHNLRINIFNETLALIKQGWYIATDGTRVELPSVDKVMEAAEMYTHKICFDNSFDRSIIYGNSRRGQGLCTSCSRVNKCWL